jgi:hypothetical protein
MRSPPPASRQFAKFAIVGVANTLISVAAYSATRSPAFASTAARSTGTCSTRAGRSAAAGRRFATSSCNSGARGDGRHQCRRGVLRRAAARHARNLRSQPCMGVCTAIVTGDTPPTRSAPSVRSRTSASRWQLTDGRRPAGVTECPNEGVAHAGRGGRTLWGANSVRPLELVRLPRKSNLRTPQASAGATDPAKAHACRARRNIPGTARRPAADDREAPLPAQQGNRRVR